MWQWLKSFWSKPAPTPEASPQNLWTPGERLIFRYHDGGGSRDVDPMPLYRRVKDVQKEVEADLVLARSQFKDNLTGYEKAARRIRGAFELKPYAEGGLTELECLNLYNAFLAWVGEQKKSTPSPSTTSADASTPTPGSSGPSNEGTSSTPSGSAGGSTGGGPTTPPPTPSPSVSE